MYAYLDESLVDLNQHLPRLPSVYIRAYTEYAIQAWGSWLQPAAHTGPVLGLTHSPDGMHLFTWGGAGASENTLCLRMWSTAPGDCDLPCRVDADAHNYHCPQLRPVNFGVVHADSAELDPFSSRTHNRLSQDQQGSRTRESLSTRTQPASSRVQRTPVRLDATYCPSGDAWGAPAAFVGYKFCMIRQSGCFLVCATGRRGESAYIDAAC
ncbi:unnamed protein product [Echinostoma caproni]|uniref:C-type lectin domain-containing protein n=1 Tax=Echinostoma caproni TaxID=27848 RepID=A0A183B1G8_9TREM|nr:unnamed protein product [Echinostoma caproni]